MSKEDSRFNSLGDLPTEAGSGAPIAGASSVSEATPVAARQMIGGYAIVQRIGEGGMGVVYEAMQQSPRRPVALKIIRGGTYVDEQAVRMFQREVQALARLKHPGIAAIYESGRTDDGQHFFAMELVRGSRLNDHLQRDGSAATKTKAAARERLELFLKICDAVSYAHQRGVIHRDLKPGNILVVKEEVSTESGKVAGQLDIKVLDFGLARIAEEDIANASLATQPGTLQGTVPYMSPEQIRANKDQMDLRTDVYSLGVILYEVLTGELPYDVRRVSLFEAARKICDDLPRPFSTTLGKKNPISREVESIVGKALEKDPSRRYQSVAAFADDIRRYLNNQPVLAQSPSTMYQVRKLVSRHKAGFSFAAAVVVLLAGFSVTMELENKRVTNERDRANREAQVAQGVSGFLVNLFNVSQPEQSRGKTITARELLDKGAANIQKNVKMDPEVKASLLDTMGDAYSSLGFFSQAKPLLDDSFKTRTSLFGSESLPVAQTLRDMGLLSLANGDDKAAEDYYIHSLDIYEKREGQVNNDVAILLNDVGTSLDHVGRLDEAQDYFQRSLDMRIKMEGPDSVDLIPMRSNLAYIAYVKKDFAGAEQEFRKELDIAEKAYGRDHPFVAELVNNIGGVLFTEKKYSEAENYYGQALALDRKLLGGEHPQVGLDLANIAEAHDTQGDLKGAEQYYRQSLGILRKKVPETDFRMRFVLTNLGSVLVREGSPANLREAESLLRPAVTADEKALPKGAWDTAEAESELGGCLLAEKRFAAAEPLLVQSYPTVRDKLGPNEPSKVTDALNRIIQLYTEWGKRAKADEYMAMKKAS